MIHSSFLGQPQGSHEKSRKVTESHAWPFVWAWFGHFRSESGLAFWSGLFAKCGGNCHPLVDFQPTINHLRARVCNISNETGHFQYCGAANVEQRVGNHVSDYGCYRPRVNMSSMVSLMLLLAMGSRLGTNPVEHNQDAKGTSTFMWGCCSHWAQLGHLCVPMHSARWYGSVNRFNVLGCLSIMPRSSGTPTSLPRARQPLLMLQRLSSGSSRPLHI